MLAYIPQSIENNLQWLAPAAIVVLGLLVYGFGDLFRFSFRRAHAISSVCFWESIRRRVLWISPLAMIGVLLVTQFQKSLDEQDAIRQTIKFTLFAAGMVVTMTAVILACTNLPREIESRVIYTVVTKPITRLEIVAGKVLGFAKVSAAILVIMGVFTLIYIHGRGWSLRRDIQKRLEAGSIDPISRPTYEYWAKEGLLSARTFEKPATLQVYAQEPNSDTRRWFYSEGDGSIVVPFFVTPELLTPRGSPDFKPGDAGIVVQLMIGFRDTDYNKAQPEPSGLPIGIAAPTTTLIQAPAKSAAVRIEFLDENLNSLIDYRSINGGQPIVLNDPSGATPTSIQVSQEIALNLLRSQLLYVSVTGATQGVEYSVDTRHEPDALHNPICLLVPGTTPDMARIIGPVDDRTTDTYQPALPTFRGRTSTYGQQLRGGPAKIAPVAVYRFRGATPRSADGSAAFEIRVRIEHSGADENDIETTRFQLIAVNRKTGVAGEPIYISPESNRTTYFSLPSFSMQDGDFDVYLRDLSPGQYVNIRADVLSLVASKESFDFNLVKSLSILWMLSILVVVIAIFCSTFLSWPIAIVLTLLLLLGHWGISQLSDSLAPGIGNMVAQDLFGSVSGASQVKVVQQSVDAMARVLNQLAIILPDIGQFSAIDDIEAGITISASSLIAPMKVLATFGLPMLALSYVLLRNKEVAP
ncbi:MAG TPA: ABC transporter permease subunit [Tepidisphaeraceae bacterium]|nr:ABC transporter permease subunit [Tepidisphaeraceae bacterium]